jgi:hypothetical protein
VSHYLLSICYPAGAQAPDSDRLAEIMAEVAVVKADLQAAGSWVFDGGLHGPDSATVVTCVDGATVLTDGPFIESKEQIGGISVIDVADLDEALAWAARMAAAVTVPVEVRPFQG